MSAQDKKPTLLCDLDPQASASFYFRIRAARKFSAKKFLKGGRQIEKNIRGTDFEHLDLLPSDLSFRNLDLQLDDLKGSRTRLRHLLSPLASDYEHVFLDCPPNITLLAENVFRAADLILVPVIPTTLSLRTYVQLSKFFKHEKLDERKLRPYFSMVEKRKLMHRQVIEKVHEKTNIFLHAGIPYLAEIEKMGIYRAPLPHFAGGSPAAAAFDDLWREITGTILFTAGRPQRAK